MGSEMSSPLRGAAAAVAGALSGMGSPLTGGEDGSAGTEIPKSPPKWPLRPGVLAYVKGDTKQNICAARNGGATTTTASASAMNHSMGSSTGPGTGTAVVSESPLNKSTVSYAATGNNNSNGSANTATRDQQQLQQLSQQSLQTRQGQGQANDSIRSEGAVSAPGDRVLRKALKTIVLSEDVAIQVEEDDEDDDEDDGHGQRQQYTQQTNDGDETNVDELINFTNSNFINRILKRLRWKRNRGGFDNRRSSPTNNSSGPKKTKKGRRRLLLLRRMPINSLFGSWKSTNSHTELFDSTRNRPAGIKYPSSGNWL